MAALSTQAEEAPGVVVTLEELVRLGLESRGLSFKARQPAHSLLSGRNASRLRGRGLDFEELRAYQPGDDLRTMDWRVTARARSPYVRVYQEAKERPVLLVVDQRASMFFGSKQEMKSVTAAKAAAVVAHCVLHSGDRVGAVVFDDQELEALPPRRSHQQVMRILGLLRDKNQELAGARPRAPNHSMLDQALSQVLRLATHDQLIVVVSDLACSSESTRKIATQIRRANDVVILWVNDPLEAALPNVGEAVLGDGHMQVQVNTESAQVRERFARDVTERRERASSFALRYDVPLLPLSTDEGVVAQLRRLLGHFAPARRA